MVNNFEFLSIKNYINNQDQKIRGCMEILSINIWTSLCNKSKINDNTTSETDVL